MQMIVTLTTEETAEKLRALGMAISPQAVRDGIQQKIFPFGDCIQNGSSRRFLVYQTKLDEWIYERSTYIQDERGK